MGGGERAYGWGIPLPGLACEKTAVAVTVMETLPGSIASIETVSTVLMASRKPLPRISIPPMPSAWTCGECVGFSLWGWTGPHSGKTDSSAGLESGGVTGTRHGPLLILATHFSPQGRGY